jgi:ABC-2 type transport system ATP-binding protein
MMDDRTLIAVSNLSMTFGSIAAVDGVSLTITESSITGVVGSDGAGKSTLLRLIATMIAPASGSITVDGYDVVREKQRVKKMIGYMPQRFGLYEDLTVRENFDFFMDIFGIVEDGRKWRRERFLGFSNLLPFVDRLAGNLSGGMKQKLGLACVLVHQPRILILDEPTNGVDPVSRREFWEILFQMKDQGMTIVISTAYLDEGERCDCLAVMHKSRLIDSGIPDAIRGEFPTLEDALIHRIEKEDEALIHDNFKF